jgi:hypothetical protein
MADVIPASAFLAGIPFRLQGIHPEGRVVRRALKAYAVKQVELKFRSYHHLIGHARLAHILLRPLRDAAGILPKAPVLRLVDDLYITGHREGGHSGKGVHTGGSNIGNKHHIALFHRRVTKIRSVKANTITHRILGETRRRDGDMVPPARQVNRFEIDHLYTAALAKILDLLNRLKHNSFLNRPFCFVTYIAMKSPEFFRPPENLRRPPAIFSKCGSVLLFCWSARKSQFFPSEAKQSHLCRKDEKSFPLGGTLRIPRAAV